MVTIYIQCSYWEKLIRSVIFLGHFFVFNCVNFCLVFFSICVRFVFLLFSASLWNLSLVSLCLHIWAGSLLFPVLLQWRLYFLLPLCIFCCTILEVLDCLSLYVAFCFVLFAWNTLLNRPVWKVALLDIAISADNYLFFMFKIYYFVFSCSFCLLMSDLIALICLLL